jgi:ATP-dependent Zn protease
LHIAFEFANDLIACGLSNVSKINPLLFAKQYKTNLLDIEIFKEINRIVDTNYDKVKNILENNKPKMELLVKALLESKGQSLTGEEVKNLLGLTIT